MRRDQGRRGSQAGEEHPLSGKQHPGTPTSSFSSFHSTAVESTGAAKAEAQSRAEAARIEGEGAVLQAKLKAEATAIETVSPAAFPLPTSLSPPCLLLGTKSATAATPLPSTAL